MSPVLILETRGYICETSGPHYQFDELAEEFSGFKEIAGGVIRPYRISNSDEREFISGVNFWKSRAVILVFYIIIITLYNNNFIITMPAILMIIPEIKILQQTNLFI